MPADSEITEASMSIRPPLEIVIPAGPTEIALSSWPICASRFDTRACRAATCGSVPGSATSACAWLLP